MSKPASNAVSAAVVRQKGGPFTIEKLQLGEPRADEVLVRIVAAGMCHTDMVVRDQVYPVPRSRSCSAMKEPASSKESVPASSKSGQATTWC